MNTSLTPRKQPAATAKAEPATTAAAAIARIHRNRRDHHDAGQPVVLQEYLRDSRADPIQPGIAGIDLCAGSRVKRQRMAHSSSAETAELVQRAKQQQGRDTVGKVQPWDTIIPYHEGEGPRQDGREARRKPDVQDQQRRLAGRHAQILCC